MKTSNSIDPKELNKKIDPMVLLGLIGYEKSSPQNTDEGVRDYCPIHGGDNQRSLCINTKYNCYICQQCQATGDLIHLYCQCKNCDFPKAIKELSKMFLPHFLEENRKIEHALKKIISNDPPIDLDKTLNSLETSGTHSYLSQKKITTPLGVRFGKDQKGNDSIVVPFTDINGSLQTLQYINEGGKFFLKGHKSTNCFFSLGEIKDRSTIYIAEGLATATTTWEALGKSITVLSAGSVGNIPNVVRVVREKHPNISIKLAIDNNEAARKILEKIPPPFSYTYPNFENLNLPETEKKADDFNDLISVCNLSPEEVKTQLLGNEIQKNPEDFAKRLGEIIGDYEYAKKLENRTYASFQKEHKEMFSKGGLITGFSKLDEQVYFSKGTFATIQGMSNHGKSTLMLHMAYRFVSRQENKKSDPMFIFITYESCPIRIEEKLLNLMSHEKEKGTLIKRNRDLINPISDEHENKHLYPQEEDFPLTITSFDRLLREKRIQILKRIPLENIEGLLDLYKKEFPTRTIVLFLDYIQIIDTSNPSQGWERIKVIAHKLEALAIDKEVVIITGAQVNEKRQAREGRDIYNASTINIDIFNHSHASLKNNPDLKDLYIPPTENKDICTLSVLKQKHGSSFILDEYLLLNGHFFLEKTKYL